MSGNLLHVPPRSKDSDEKSATVCSQALLDLQRCVVIQYFTD